MAPGNVALAEEHYRGLWIWVMRGHHYLGGFIGDAEAEQDWLGGGKRGWSELVKVLAEFAHKHPQSAYAGLQKSLQQE